MNYEQDTVYLTHALASCRFGLEFRLDNYIAEPNPLTMNVMRDVYHILFYYQNLMAEATRQVSERWEEVTRVYSSCN